MARSSLVSSASGKLAVLVGGEKPYCRIWNLRTGREEPGINDDGVAHKPLLSPDGKLLATYCYDSHVTVWDTTKRILLRRFQFVSNTITAWTFSMDGRFLVVGHGDGSFSTWRVADGKQVAEVKEHPGGVVALACSPDGETLVSSCTGCTILQWTAARWRSN